MTVNNNTILNSIRQLETVLFHDDILNETEAHPLIIFRDQLQEIDCKSELITIDDAKKLGSILHSYEIKFFENFIHQYSSLIPPSILKAVFDIMRFQINLNMRINQSMSDYYFHLSLDYLIADSTIDYLNGKKELTTTNIDEYFLHLFSSIGAYSIYTKIDLSYSISVSHKKIPSFFQLNYSTDRLLHAFMNYLNNYFLNNSQQHQSHIAILKWLVNITNIYGFVPYFLKTNYPDAVLQWITSKRNTNEFISTEIWFLVINLLHNLARHRLGVKALSKLKAIGILKQWKVQYITELSSVDCNENDKDILVAYYLVYAVLLEPKELKKETMSNIQTVLDYILERTVQAFDSADHCCGPYNVCEYLSGLAKLVVNDTFLVYIISRDHIYELFIEKFFLFNINCETTELNTIICSSLYTIFWSISFLPDYNMRLKSNETFISLVEQTAKNESNDEYAVIMRRAAKGILFNLDLIEMDIQPIEDQNTNNNDNNQPKVMISYAHKDTTFCKKLVTNLQHRFQGDIWVDFNKLSPPYEDDWEEIAKAITKCDVIIIIVTENYCSSKSCRREVIHADKRNKRMIPVYQGKDYKPEDWFEIRVGSAIWVRFGDKKSDDEVVENLFGLINVRDKVKSTNEETVISNEQYQIHTSNISDTQTPMPVNTNPIIELPSNPVTSNIVPSSVIDRWTGEEVQKWLRLPPSTLQLSSGRALLTYINLLSNEDAQCDEYEQRMRHRGMNREEYSNLISSFVSLRSSRNIETMSTDLWTCEEIKYWFHQNHLSDYLLNSFNFTNGSELLTYAKLILDSPSRIDEEYDRLRNQIGKVHFHLNDYARLLNAFKQLVIPSQKKEEPIACTIL